MTTPIDWIAYFREFSQTHGGNPVFYRENKVTGEGGYLLFSDGWMYSRLDASGPEIPPSDEKDAKKKVRAYWAVRLAVLKEALTAAREEVLRLAREQDSRSAELQTVRMVDKQVETAPLDFDLLVERVRDLHSQVEECRERLQNPVVCSPPQRESLREAWVMAQLQLIELERVKRNPV